MRALLLALTFVAANSYVALAQDDEPAPSPRKPAAYYTIRHSVKTAAIQAPAPMPRPRPPAPATLSQSQAQQNPAAVLQKFTLADLQAALADAQAQNPPDQIAANCYQELITVVQSPAANPLPSGPGAFQLFQKGRDLANLVAAMQSNNGPITQLKIACAPLIMDTQTVLVRLGVIGGAVAATGGLLP